MCDSSIIFLGPMSKNIVDCVIEYANCMNVKFTLIPSRRQIEYDGGYVNNWTTSQFSKYIKEKTNNIYIERDHGGACQGNIMDDGLKSFAEDSVNFDIIHIDPWKKYNKFDEGLEETIKCINYCNSINPNLIYEIGTEESIRKFEIDELEKFILEVKNRLDENIFLKIKYLVIQCGTKLKECNNCGNYDRDKLKNMINICDKYNLTPKEHNGDWVTIDLIKEKVSLGLNAINIAPELGQLETKVILNELKLLPTTIQNDIFEEIYQICLNSNKWIKWVSEDFIPDQNKEHLINICCHYIFSNKNFIEIKNKINKNIDSIIKAYIFDKLREYHSLLPSYYKVLITTSGIGSRLGNMTKYINKSLIKVGDKFGICYIIEKYKMYAEFVITLGYYGNIVKQFLLLAYPSYKFTFVEIDNFNGSGSSLGYSLLKTKQFLNCPFIFHCCDSIVLDDYHIVPSVNTIYVNKNIDSHSYSSVTVSNDNVINIYDKGEKVFDYVYVGISYIKNYETYWHILDKLYKQDPNNSCLGDVNILKELVEIHSIKFKTINQWYDTGNIREINTRIIHEFECKYTILPKLDESICFMDKDECVIKYFYNTEKCKKLIKRGLDLYPLVPKILAYSDNFIKMEMIEGELMSKNVKYGEIKKLLNWSKKNLWKDSKCYLPDFKNICFNFYYSKTKNRINDALIKLKDFEIINGLYVGKIDDLLKKINFSELTNSEPTLFHGDFILDNIIKVDENNYKLIDWREDFGGDTENGDKYYDLAKMRHNIIFNHENIINGLYTVVKKEEEVIVDIKCNYSLIQQLCDYDNFILENNINMDKIKILTSLIWLNMSSLHDYPISEFLYYFGKYNLYICLNKNDIDINKKL